MTSAPITTLFRDELVTLDRDRVAAAIGSPHPLAFVAEVLDSDERERLGITSQAIAAEFVEGLTAVLDVATALVPLRVPGGPRQASTDAASARRKAKRAARRTTH